MRFTRVLLLVVLASAFAGAQASSASALGFEDDPCAIGVDSANPQLKVCHPNAEVGKLYTLNLNGKGGCTPTYVRYDIVNGSLPPGLRLTEPSLGTITGIPTQAGIYRFWAQISDMPGGWCADSKQSQWEFQITVLPGLKIVQSGARLTSAETNVPYSNQLTASGANGATLQWSVASGSLPPGINLNSSTGLLSGTATSTGDYAVGIKVTDGTRSDIQHYTFSVVEPLKVTSPGAAAAEVGVAFQATLTASGGKSGYTWSIASGTALPAGLTLNGATGAITGTPTAGGVFAVKLTVTDSTGLTQSIDYRVVVAARLALVRRGLPAASVGRRYSARLLTRGGVAPRTWRIASGSLPAGLRLNARTGVITGSARHAGNARFTIRVTDKLGVVSTASFSLKVVG